MSRAGTVHVVVPEGVGDPERASGGNTYDRRLCRGLADAGWSVREHAVTGPRALSQALTAVGEGQAVVVDGLLASTEPEVLVPASSDRRVVVLLHLPVGATTDEPRVRDRERAVLTAAAAVVTTSAWTREWVLREYALSPHRVHVSEPGVDRADLASGSPTGHRLLCVAACVPAKGHDVLLTALAGVRDLGWRCVCVGSLRRDPDHVARLVRQSLASGIADRVELVGPRTGVDLQASYAAADVLVHPSRLETYGMVVTEALAHGLPVVTSAVGGLPETVGRPPDGGRPGLLVAPGDADALALALRRWLRDRDLRASLRRAARSRRRTLAGWDATAARVSRVLTGVAA